MKIEIKYNKDVENNFIVFVSGAPVYDFKVELNSCADSSFQIFSKIVLDYIDKNYKEFFHYSCVGITTKFIEPIVKGVYDEVDKIYHKVHTNTFKIDATPKYVCRIENENNSNSKLTKDNVFKFTITKGKAHIVTDLCVCREFALHKIVDNTISTPSSRVELDYEKFEKEVDLFIDGNETSKSFEVFFKEMILESEDNEDGIHIHILYDFKVKKYILKYKSCKTTVDYSSISASNLIEGFEKFNKVLDSFKTRINIMLRETVEIKHKKKSYDNIISFQKGLQGFVKNSIGTAANYNFLKPSSNVQGL